MYDNQNKNFFNRRNFLKITVSALVTGSIANAQVIPYSKKIETDLSYYPKGLIKPNGLKKGSRVAIVATSSQVNQSEVARGAKILDSHGCKVEYSKIISGYKPTMKYLAASDSDRAEELMRYLKRDDIDCIFCARGGYGIPRILDKLDFSNLIDSPKIIIGFSDVTALINSSLMKSGVASFHGPMASSRFTKFSEQHLLNAIFQNKKRKPVIIQDNRFETVSSGKAKGRFVGGNLSALTGLIGTPFEVDTQNAILLLEDVFEEPYRIDRMFSQLHLSGAFKRCSAVALGNFDGLNAVRNFFPGYSFTIKEIIFNWLSSLGKPVLLGLPFGHIPDNLTIPLGVIGELDATKKTLSIIESGVID